MQRILSTFALCLAVALPLGAKPLTSLQALQIAAKQMPPASQQRLMIVRGDRSQSELTPDTWHFVFYDDLADQNGREITVTGKTVSGIRDGYFDLGQMRLAAYKMEEIIDPSTFKIDSDKALDILTQTNLLKPYSLSSVLYDLTRDKDLREPVWKLRVYVDNGSGKEKNIGYARISAEDGKIIEMKFKPFEPNPQAQQH